VVNVEFIKNIVKCFCNVLKVRTVVQQNQIATAEKIKSVILFSDAFIFVVATSEKIVQVQAETRKGVPQELDPHAFDLRNKKRYTQ
jgi:hypothetical protein